MKDLLQQQLHLRGMDPLQGRKLFVLKRDARIEEFNDARISLAIESAFKAVQGISHYARLPEPLQAAVKKCADAVVERILSRAVRGEQLEVELIQDAVEDQLMLDGQLAVARCYILYREKRRLARVEREGRVKPAVKKKVAEPAPPLPATSEPAPAREKEPPAAAPNPWLQKIYSQALPKPPTAGDLEAAQRAHFSVYLAEAEYLKLIAPEMLAFDLPKLAGALRLERDGLFPPSGLRALHDDFLLHENGRRIETPQFFWMRLAMGLALNEGEQRNARALEFYEALSTFRFLPSETILGHAGRADPRLLDCSASTSWSDLEHVTVQAGPGLAHRGKKGLTCSWLEPWHSGIWDFLQRPRPGEPPWSHDLNKALWVPDLFMKRVREQGRWTLLDPDQAPGLHQKFGREFEELYREYEESAERGEMPGARRINAVDLWQEILASVAQAGQPWFGFKDAANIRSLQDNGGIVRKSSICTAILLNGPPAQASACAVGSLNLAAHLGENAAMQLDVPLLRRTVATALRILDNAVDISSYPDDAPRKSAMENRPVALGICGFQDALDKLKTDYASVAAADFADRSMELISHCALIESANLARERGAYPAYAASKWSHGLLPVDTLALLADTRASVIDVDLSKAQDWETVRDMVQLYGLRHCATTGISSTEAASRITGVSPSIEPVRLERDGKARTTFAKEPHWLIECAARRQKWLDMGQELNIYAADINLTELAEIIMQAWEKGLKTVRQFHLTARPPGGVDFAVSADPARQKPQPAAAP